MLKIVYILQFCFVLLHKTLEQPFPNWSLLVVVGCSFQKSQSVWPSVLPNIFLPHLLAASYPLPSSSMDNKGGEFTHTSTSLSFFLWVREKKEKATNLSGFLKSNKSIRFSLSTQHTENLYNMCRWKSYPCKTEICKL